MEDPNILPHVRIMCGELESRCSDFEGKKLKLMLYLCLIAYGSEIRDGVCAGAWLRTTIKLNAKDEFEVMAGISNVPVLCQACWEQLKRHEYFTVTSTIEIRSNILPRQAYLETLRLQELQEEPVSLNLVCEAEEFWHLRCCIDKGRLHPIRGIKQPREERVLRVKKDGGRCGLTIQLRPNDVQHTVAPLNPNDVVSNLENDSLGAGASGTVTKVSWRKGTYAMKSYNHPGIGENERRYIELRILHPHLVHGVYYATEDGDQRLLMEILDFSLTRYALLNAMIRETPLLLKPVFSSAEDTFDVLLQIARAMEYLHRNNVVHGDLKPDNILLDYFEILGNGRHFLAKVTDFGDVQVVKPGNAFVPGFGTNQYAAPELLEWRIRGEGLAHPKKIDVYGFRAVAHEVLTGYPVYHGGRHNFRKVEFKNGVITGNLKPSECMKWRILKWSMRFKLWKFLGLKERFPERLIELVESCWELRPEDRPEFSRICEVLEDCKASILIRDHGADDLSKFIAIVLFSLAVVCLAALIKILLL